ncbi:VOC family protein [Pedobacter zeae]|uniref:VOC domain-containing protein n=1 Tax=Pedobacter zeae TaxID=1737356 RepID=A0A7W6K9G8_9SPHI|nr:hypothetical protein [Pedobacter zeae]MBB4106696.1 hypothetical protein [Pedobacter zeae]GGH03205.1 hypothetical protein GCM10007422_18090 [Pedobacter zeae]
MRKNKIPLRISVNGKPGTAQQWEALANILGAKKILDDPGLSVYKLKDNTVLEIYGIGLIQPQRIFKDGDMVIGFQVDDLENSVDMLLKAGVQPVDGIIRTCESYAYSYLLIDGKLFGLYQID